MDFTLWIDADSLPVNHRRIVLKRVISSQIETFFVADRSLPDVEEAIRETVKVLRDPYRDAMEYSELRKIKSFIRMVVVKAGENSADNYIVDHISPPALCVTHDVLLSSRVIEKGARVMDDRGKEYDKGNINERLSVKETMEVLREEGVFAEKQKRFDSALREKFANTFDRIITQMTK